MKNYLFIFLALFSLSAFADKGCDEGYALKKSSEKKYGIDVYLCEKVWCVDLETGESMGKGNSASSGYSDTTVQDFNMYSRSIKCFGKRDWCGNSSEGEFNPEKGIYVHPEDLDGNKYISYKDGNCFAWKDKE